jgi:transcriptional regulator with XRE-family HTH domain
LKGGVKVGYGVRIKELRVEMEMTQDEMAEKTGYTRSAIASWETERREPDIPTFQRLAEFFGVQTEYVMGISDERNKPWWEKDEPPSDIELEEFVKNNSNIKLMGDPLDEKAKDDVLMFLRAAHELIKEKRRTEK